MGLKLGRKNDSSSTQSLSSSTSSAPVPDVAAPPLSVDPTHLSRPIAPQALDIVTSNPTEVGDKRSELRDDDREAVVQGVGADIEASQGSEAQAAEESPAKYRYRPYTLLDKQQADRIAREAVHAELERQADKARYDISDGNRVVLVLDEESLRTYTADWNAFNLTANAKIAFTEYLATRLRACRTHTSTRPIYVTDNVRQQIEDLFSEAVTSDIDLRNQIDRHIRPIMESADLPDGVLRFKPLDPTLVEMIGGWYPDKTVAEAVSDFMVEATQEKAGIL